MPRLTRSQRGKRAQIVLLTLVFLGSWATASAPQEKSDNFAALRQRLVTDGFSVEAIAQLYSRPEVFVEADGVSRFFVHSEAKLNYDQFSTAESIERAQRYLQENITVMSAAEATYARDLPTTAVMDGGNGMGQVDGFNAMKLAIDKARQLGMGAVAVRNSSHYGIAGYYAKMALDEVMLGMAFTNARPAVTPTFGAYPLLGTNPIAFGMPTDEPFPFLFDAATAVAARGKIEVLDHAHKPTPAGWIINADGTMPTDSEQILKDMVSKQAALLPLGGAGELFGGHKGYGLGTMVEILSSTLQSGAYLSGLGRLQCLPIAWDVREKKWYHLYPKEPLDPMDWLYWTNAAQNWNGMCAECHSTNLKKNYDLRTDTYRTTWSDIDVVCEACHGPGSRHVQWAEMPDMARPRVENVDLVVKTSGLGSHKLVELCAPCHSRRASLGDYTHAEAVLLDSMFPSLLTQELYFPDGQILDEVYVYGSFTQSKMYHRDVRCSDCHDVHGNKVIKEGNALCLQCHRAAEYDSKEHHFHKKKGEKG